LYTRTTKKIPELHIEAPSISIIAMSHTANAYRHAGLVGIASMSSAMEFSGNSGRKKALISIFCSQASKELSFSLFLPLFHGQINDGSYEGLI
jgi:hypothetical protein